MKLSAGPVGRTRKSQRRYKHHMKTQASKECDFCAFMKESTQVIKEFTHFWHVENIFGYNHWDGCKVEKHHMIVPKRHVRSLSHLNLAEKSEYMDIISEAEADGYQIYSRSDQTITKSVPHQHTHLIKTMPKRLKFLLYLRAPHFVLFN